MSGKFLQQSRHGTTYFFRRRVPDDLQLLVGHRQLYKSLCTSCRRTAIILARMLAVKTDRYFSALRMSNDNDNDDAIRLDWVLSYDMGDLGLIKVESQPHDTDDDKAQAVEAFKNATRAAIAARATAATVPNVRQASAGAGKTFEQAVVEYLGGCALKPRSLKSYRVALEAHAIPFFGAETPLSSIDQERFAAFVAHIMATEERSDATFKGYAYAVTAMFKWQRSRVNDLPVLTSATLLPKQNKPDEDERNAFSLEQMSVLFSNAKRYLPKEPCKYWVTLATAVTGCRVEELAQINLETDLLQDSATGRWYLTLNEKPDRDGVVRKSLKRKSSWRVVPIHSALERIGFIDFLKAQLTAGFSRPFQSQWEAWLDKSTGGLKWSHSVSKWGGRELAKLNADGRLDRAGLELAYFHSMRHTFASVLVQRRVPEEERSALQGQQYGGINAERYAKLRSNFGYLSEIVEANMGDLVALLA